MNAPFFVSPPMPVPMPDPAPGMAEVTDLLRQLLDVQREQVVLLKNQQAMQDQNAKWKAFLSKWAGEFPDLGGACKQSLPMLERAFLSLIRELTNRLKPEDPDDLENEYTLNEFLDKYGIRLGQLATILSQVGPLAEAAPPPETPTPPASPG
jgi:hypothetical protein